MPRSTTAAIIPQISVEDSPSRRRSFSLGPLSSSFFYFFISCSLFSLPFFVMLSITAVLFVFSFMAVALCRPSAARPGMILRDVHPTIPEGYSAGGNAPPSGSTLRLTLAMPHSNISGLSAALMDVSDPTSQNYGRHLSKADVCAQ